MTGAITRSRRLDLASLHFKVSRMRQAVIEQRRHGSHMILRRDNPFVQPVVPDHREPDRQTLGATLRQSVLSVEGFNELL